MVWLTEMQLARGIVTEAMNCEKARATFTDLMQQTPPSTFTHEVLSEPFKVSRVWFEYLKKQVGIHPFVTHGKAAEYYLKTFAGIVAAEGYISQ